MSGFKDLGLEPWKFMNTVRKQLRESDRSDVPIYRPGDTDFTGVGELLADDPNFANKWHKAAINVISKKIMNDNKIVNPWAEFEGDLVPNGDKLEEMIIDTANMYQFNPSVAEKTLFDRRAPELKAIIHKSKRDVTGKLTLQDTVYTEIFSNVNELDSYVVTVTESLISGNEFGKYYTMKETLSQAIYRNKVRTFDLGSNNSAKLIQKYILKHSKKMLHPSRNYNMGNVGQPGANNKTGINIQADRLKLRLVLPIETAVNVNVDFLASQFHLDSVQADIAIKEVDEFPSLYQYSADHTVTETDIANGFLDGRLFQVGSTVPAGAAATEEAYIYALEDAETNGTTSDIEQVFDGSRVQAMVMDARALKYNPMIPMTISSVANPEGRYTNVILNDKAISSFSPFMPSFAILADPVDDGMDDNTSGDNTRSKIKDIQLDGESIVDQTGIANIPYSAETEQAATEVFESDSSTEGKKVAKKATTKKTNSVKKAETDK